MSVQFIWNRKRTACYVYAYKGGPCILKHDGPRKPKLTAAHRIAIGKALEDRSRTPDDVLITLIRQWRRSPEWKNLAPGTRKTWGAQLDIIESRWGSKPIEVWNDPRMTAKVVKWRDERASTPRAADIGVTVLKALLKFGRLHGKVKINAADAIPQLYKGGARAEIIWTKEDMEAFRVAAIKLKRPALYDGLRLASLTGLRLADLVSLTWDHLGEVAIVKTALKTSRGRRRRAVVPMTEALETLLGELRGRKRKEGVNTILVNESGRPWTAAGFGGSGSFGLVRDKAGIVHVDEEGGERKKHLHDVRGTFCTLLLTECELTDREAADIMAWSPERVANIRKVYVDHARVVVAIAERMAAKRGAKQREAQS